ncbi:MAG: hypothetical protein M5U01_43455 [Ardenticatenaceae bacterium]|nr:hypothetical protein [Ardenticatenaceae bacterium]HBY96235.1 hypothetical protein [Chloroflexota bacterium]
MSDPEAGLERWIEAESRAAERRRLHAQLRQYDMAEMVSYVAILAWVIAMFVGYYLGWVSAALAGLVTLWSFLAGAFVIWQIKIRQRAVRAQLVRLDAD